MLKYIPNKEEEKKEKNLNRHLFIYQHFTKYFSYQNVAQGVFGLNLAFSIITAALYLCAIITFPTIIVPWLLSAIGVIYFDGDLMPNLLIELIFAGYTACELAYFLKYYGENEYFTKDEKIIVAWQLVSLVISCKIQFDLYFHPKNAMLSNYIPFFAGLFGLLILMVILKKLEKK